MASILALDYGGKRVGVAIARAGFSHPLVTLANDGSLIKNVCDLITENEASELIVGLPRNLNGDDTVQTTTVREFVNQLKSRLTIPVYLIDEAATSVEAEAKLKAGKKPYVPKDIDALAAALILDNYLANERDRNQV
ncbi:MAG: Holliday junction resolvase RuvX [Candidatus Saccharimonadales bacterium]